MNSTITITLLLSCTLCVGLDAQRRGDKSQEQLKAQRAEKLEKSFLENANWILDYDEARKVAQKEGKFLLTYFTRTFSP